MKEYLIQCSHTATGRKSTWDNTTFNLIGAWLHLGKAFPQLTIGQRIQLSKYIMNDLLPTLRRLQTFNNKMDSHCFECGQLWEDTNHVLRCPGDARTKAHDEAFKTFFHQNLLKQHTPDIMATLICNSMHSWVHRSRIFPPNLVPPH
jgi:hypothetical protein